MRQWISKLKFLRAFLIAVRDPSRTDEILKLTGDPRMMGGENHQPVFESIARHPISQNFLKNKKLPSWDLLGLQKLPRGTVGAEYCMHLSSNGLTEKFYQDLESDREIDFVRTWIRKTHDIVHVLTGFDTSVEGEAGLQAFYFAQLRARGSVLIVAIAVLHDLLHRPERLPSLFEQLSRGWNLGNGAAPLFGQPFEAHWEEDLQNYRRQLGLAP